MYFTAALLLLAPLSWFDLDSGQRVELTQKISLGEKVFPAGTSLELVSKEPLAIPGASLELLKLEQAPCPRPEWESEMEIVLPDGNPESSSVGIQLEQNCRWWVYVEEKDLFTPSFFAPTSAGSSGD